MKNRIANYLCVIGLVSSILACAETKVKNTANNKQLQITEEEVKASVMDSTHLAILVSGYLKIKNALVETNAEAASFAAENLRYNLKNNDDKVLFKILQQLKAIETSKDVDEQRITFENLSADIYQLAKIKNLNGQVLYQQYCPMAFNNKGAYWISDEERVYNPYFGNKMLRCGKVTEVLK